MAGPKIDVYNIGREGVNVDSDDVHMLDGSFRKAQNWQVEPSGASGIRRRDGMTPLNGAAMAGAGAGIIGVPLPDLSVLSRTLFLPYNDANVSAITWRKSSDSGATWANIQLGHKPQQSADIGTMAIFSLGLMRWATLNNKIYFPARAGRNVGGTNPTINVFDGLTSYTLAAVPPNPNAPGNAPYGVLSIVPYSSTQLIFTTTDDTGGGGPGGLNRVFLLDVKTGQITQLGPQTTLLSVIWCPIVYAGKIWIGTANTSGGSASKVYWIRPGDTTWTLDFTSPATEGYIFNFATFKGDLYAGFGADVGSNGKIRKRTTNGVWSVVHTSDGTGAGNYCGPLITSLDGATIYAFRWSVSGGAVPIGRILKSTDGAAWTQDYDAGGTAGSSYQGIPILDPNGSGDIFWCMFDATGIGAGRFVRNRGGVYIVLDAINNYRGPICYLNL